MKSSRPSNVVIRIFVSLLLLMAFFVLGSIIYHIAQQAKESDRGLRDPEKEVLKYTYSLPKKQRLAI